jgi:MFS transporter, DHA2 family, multidrug resistance protein
MSKKNLFIFFILLSGFVLNMISAQIVGSSLKYLQGELNASIEQISYVMSASLIAEVIIIPFSGLLMRLLSTRVFFLISLLGFIISSIGCAISDSFLPLILFRGLQGLFGGAMIPIMMANTYMLFKPKEIPIILSIAATFGVSSIAFGPILGGMLTEYLNWRWMFLYNIPVGIIIFILGCCFIDLKKRDDIAISKIDFQGIILLAISLIALLLFLGEGERRDWFFSNFIFYCFIVFIFSFIFFIRRELTYNNPVIDLSIFIEKNFFIGAIICCIFAINIYPPIFLIPVFITKLHHIDPIDIGLIVSIMGIGMMLTSPIAGPFLKAYGVKPIIILGSLITGLGAYMQSFITADYVLLDFIPSQLLKGIGTQLLFMGSQFICFSSLQTSKVPNAAAMYNLTMRLTAAVSIAIANNYFILFKNQIFSQISDYNNTETLNLNARENDNSNSNFLENLLLLYERESFIIAFNKISYLSLWTSAIPLLFLIFFYRKNKLFKKDQK